MFNIVTGTNKSPFSPKEHGKMVRHYPEVRIHRGWFLKGNTHYYQNSYRIRTQQTWEIYLHSNLKLTFFILCYIYNIATKKARKSIEKYLIYCVTGINIALR
jgi:hypothetical protein